MLDSLAVVVEIPGELLALIALAMPVLVYFMARRASQSSTVTKSEVLTDKTVDNVKELWEKRDDLRDDVAALRERLARIEGAHLAKGCFPNLPPTK